MIEKLGCVYVATLPDGSFGGAGCSWQTLDSDAIVSALSRHGYDAKLVTIHELRGINLEQNDVVFYTSSDESSVRGYLRDFFYFINKCCEISPPYEMLLSHENKGFQQLYRDWHGFGDLDGGYFFDLDDVGGLLSKKGALVYKTVGGAGSSGVSLVRSVSDLKRIRRKDFNLSIKRKIIKFQRRIALPETSYQVYAYRHKGFGLAVWQDYISGLECDYKVLVFGERYFVLKRSVRKGDFRASGSGGFSFVEPPRQILHYALKVFAKLDVPYASLDITLSDDGCSLIEFQCLNFGPYTMLNSEVYYVSGVDGWVSREVNFSLEDCFFHGMAWYLERRKSA